MNILRYTKSKVIKGNNNIMSEKTNIETFSFKVIALLFINNSKWFLYNFVTLNHLLNLSDPRAKQKDAKRSKGVVGNIGTNIPIVPSITDITPTKI